MNKRNNNSNVWRSIPSVMCNLPSVDVRQANLSDKGYTNNGMVLVPVFPFTVISAY